MSNGLQDKPRKCPNLLNLGSFLKPKSLQNEKNFQSEKILSKKKTSIMFVSVALKTLLKGIFLAWVTGILDVQCITFQAPVVQKLDIHWMNLYPVDNSG